MFKLGWIELFRPDSTIEIHATVAVLIHHFGFYSLNACRIVYVITEERRGFAYGTVLYAAVLVSGYLPARRASNIAPIEALRYE